MSKRRGRPEHSPDKKSRLYVEEMSGAGIPQESIARTIGISVVTLRKHYRDELDSAGNRLVAKIYRHLVKRALGDDTAAVSACMFIMKARGGWTDRPAGGQGGPPVVSPDALDVWGGE